MRRYVCRRDSGRNFVVEHYGKSGCAPQVRRRGAGVGIAGASGKHCSGCGYGVERSRCIEVGCERGSIHARSGFARLVACGHTICQRICAGKRHSAACRKSFARAHFRFVLTRKRRYAGTSAISVRNVVGFGRTHANYRCKKSV